MNACIVFHDSLQYVCMVYDSSCKSMFLYYVTLLYMCTFIHHVISMLSTCVLGHSQGEV